MSERTLITETLGKVGETVVLRGWVATKRDHGKLTFIDLRDRTGVVQCVGYQKMGELTTESVVELTAVVKQRPEKMVNKDLETGSIEVDVQEYKVLNKAKELPLQVEGDAYEVGEETRLKYRYLDLRRTRLNNMLKLRSQFTRAIRDAFYEKEFVEVETPILTKSTKEGARDFLVPSRFQPGKFYALPQSPQQYKQLLMTAGLERYFQIARCFRDEDLRTDRGFEFTQLDVEMSFVTQEDVRNTVEDALKKAVKAVGAKLQNETFPVIDYQAALEKYGSDKFDMRTEDEKKDGTLAFAWVIKYPFFKKVDKADAAEVRDGKSGWTFTHNPFSSPIPEHEELLLKGEKIEEIITTQYDLVCNGYEIGSGSIRAHTPEMLKATFRVMGYTDEEIQAGVGHMLEAFEVGTPPHGGIALGMDRLIFLLLNEKSLKEVIAFPMTSTGRTSVMDAPAEVTPEQLAETGLQLKGAQHGSVYERIMSKLQQSSVQFDHYEHDPVVTSEESARVRNSPMHEGAKALVMQADKEFILFVLPADLRADLEKLQKFLGVKKLAMASRESVKAKTGIEVGAIPPLGSTIGLKTYVDSRLADNVHIFFNAGRHDRSIRMEYKDFIRLEQPVMLES